MLVAFTSCGSGYTHVPVILHSIMCNIDNIGYPLSQHYCVNLHIFCSSLSPPLLSFSFDQLFGSLSVHMTAGVHTDSSVLYHDVIYCSLQWERVQRMSQFGHWAKISGPNQNLLVHLQSLSDPIKTSLSELIIRTHSCRHHFHAQVCAIYKLFCFNFFLQLHQAQKTHGRQVVAQCCSQSTADKTRGGQWSPNKTSVAQL